MRNISKLAMAAAFGLALALTFSCSSDKDDDTPGGGPGTGGNSGGGSKEIISSVTSTMVEYDRNGSGEVVSSIAISEYDNKGNEIKHTSYNPDGSISHINRY